MIILKAKKENINVFSKQEHLNSNMIILKDPSFLRSLLRFVNLNSNMIILKVIAKILTLV